MSALVAHLVPPLITEATLDTKQNSTPTRSKRTCTCFFYRLSVYSTHFVFSLLYLYPRRIFCSLSCSLEAMSHPRCVGWGEIGLDYHYDNSPRDIQQSIFRRQLRQAVRLGKPLTIHTREAEEDTERILKEEVPKHHRVRFSSFSSDRSCEGLTCERRILMEATDTSTLLYGFTGASAAPARPLPKPLHRNHRSQFLYFRTSSLHDL